MAKRPHGDVERTKEGLDEEFYAGIAKMRLKAGMEMGRWGYRPQIILPLPLFVPPPSVCARVLSGTEALAAASYATVVLQDACEWLPEEDLLEPSEEAMRMQVEDADQDAASGQVAPAQDADVQAAAPETEECIYWKDNCWWKDRGREQRQWYGNWQAPWSGTWSGASWSARGNWQ